MQKEEIERRIADAEEKLRYVMSRLREYEGIAKSLCIFGALLAFIFLAVWLLAHLPVPTP